MKKILFVSDIHLNLKRNKDWEEKRFKQLFNFIKNYDSDYIILGGDIFDVPNPTIEELGLFYNEVEKIDNKEIIVISGNHENINKNQCLFDLIPQTNFKYFSKGKIKIEDVYCYFVSHHKIKNIKDLKINENKVNILFSHFRSKLGLIKAEIATKPISKKFDYVFVGDLHNGEYSPEYNIHYCGSPYSITYTQPYQTGVFEIIIDKNKVSHKFIKTNFPNRWKLFLDYEQYINGYMTLNDNNLYKVVVKCSNDEFTSLPKLDNVVLIHESLSDEDDLDITNKYFKIDIIEELKEAVKNSENLSKTYEIENLIEYVFDKIKKES